MNMFKLKLLTLFILLIFAFPIVFSAYPDTLDSDNFGTDTTGEWSMSNVGTGFDIYYKALPVEIDNNYQLTFTINFTLFKKETFGAKLYFGLTSEITANLYDSAYYLFDAKDGNYDCTYVSVGSAGGTLDSEFAYASGVMATDTNYNGEMFMTTTSISYDFGADSGDSYTQPVSPDIADVTQIQYIFIGLRRNIAGGTHTFEHNGGFNALHLYVHRDDALDSKIDSFLKQYAVYGNMPDVDVPEVSNPLIYKNDTFSCECFNTVCVNANKTCVNINDSGSFTYYMEVEEMENDDIWQTGGAGMDCENLSYFFGNTIAKYDTNNNDVIDVPEYQSAFYDYLPPDEGKITYHEWLAVHQAYIWMCNVSTWSTGWHNWSTEAIAESWLTGTGNNENKTVCYVFDTEGLTLEYNKTYWVRVYVNDSVGNKSFIMYQFNTLNENPITVTPVLGIYNVHGVNVSIGWYNATLTHALGEAMNYTIEISSGNSSSGNGVTNGTISCEIDQVLTTLTEYTVWINVTSECDNRNYIFTFETEIVGNYPYVKERYIVLANATSEYNFSKAIPTDSTDFKVWLKDANADDIFYYLNIVEDNEENITYYEPALWTFSIAYFPNQWKSGKLLAGEGNITYNFLAEWGYPLRPDTDYYIRLLIADNSTENLQRSYPYFFHTTRENTAPSVFEARFLLANGTLGRYYRLSDVPNTATGIELMTYDREFDNYNYLINFTRYYNDIPTTDWYAESQLNSWASGDLTDFGFARINWSHYLKYNLTYWVRTILTDEYGNRAFNSTIFTVQGGNHTAPYCYDERPLNGTENVSIRPVIEVYVRDDDKDAITVRFYNDNDELIGVNRKDKGYWGSWVGYSYYEATASNTTYYWYVTLNGRTDLRFPPTGYYQFTTVEIEVPYLYFTVRDALNYTGLPNVTITMLYNDVQHLTDATGHYLWLLDNSYLGNYYEFNFEKDGYVTQYAQKPRFPILEGRNDFEIRLVPDTEEIIIPTSSSGTEGLSADEILVLFSLLMFAIVTIFTMKFSDDYRAGITAGLVVLALFSYVGWLPFWLILLIVIDVAVRIGLFAKDKLASDIS